MEATKETEGPVYRVTLRSSTKNRPEVTSSDRNRRSRRGSKKKIVLETDSSDGSPNPENMRARPGADNGSGVVPHRIAKYEGN